MVEITRVSQVRFLGFEVLNPKVTMQVKVKRSHQVPIHTSQDEKESAVAPVAPVEHGDSTVLGQVRSPGAPGLAGQCCAIPFLESQAEEARLGTTDANPFQEAVARDTVASQAGSAARSAG